MQVKTPFFGIFITHSLTNTTLVGSAGGILTMGAAPGPGAAGAGGGGGRIDATGVVATGAVGTAGAGGGATGIAPEKNKNPLILNSGSFLAERKITY